MSLQKSKGIFIRLMFFLNIIAVLFLLLSYSAAYVSPDGHFWWLQIFGLAYGLLLVVNTAFVVFWIILRRKRFLFSLLAILIGFWKIFSIFEPRITSDKTPLVNATTHFPLKVMSFNVRLFDLYNWFHSSQTKAKIFEFLKKESPDIICFQEYYHCDKKGSGSYNNDTLRSILKAAYPHIEYTVTLRNTDHWGIATFSKHRIINRQAYHFKKRGGNIFIYSDIVVGNDTLRVFNTHLESIRFKSEDYRYMENLNNDVEQDELAGGIRILQRMKRPYARRARQIDFLKDSINASPYPVIVCGDLNDVPSSYTYNKISGDLKDAFRESGSGFGKTYAGIFPSFRIDYIFHSSELNSSNYQTHREKISDHYPISCWVNKD